MKKSKTPGAAEGAKWLEYYSPKEELNRLFNSVLKKHRCKAAPEAKSNTKKPEK